MGPVGSQSHSSHYRGDGREVLVPSPCAHVSVLMFDLHELDIILRQPSLWAIEFDVLSVNDAKLLQFIILLILLLHNLDVHSTENALLCWLLGSLRLCVIIGRPLNIVFLLLFSRCLRRLLQVGLPLCVPLLGRQLNE